MQKNLKNIGTSTMFFYSLFFFFFFCFCWVWNKLEQFCCCLTQLDHFQMLKCSENVWLIECHQWRVDVVPSVWLGQWQRKINKKKKKKQTRGEKRKIKILKALNQNTINSDLSSVFFFFLLVLLFSFQQTLKCLTLYYSMWSNMEKM